MDFLRINVVIANIIENEDFIPWTMTAKVIASKMSLIRRLKIVEKNKETLALLEVAKNRCEKSYNDLFELYTPQIYRYARSKQMNEAQSYDLVQEVMSHVWLKAHLFDSTKGEASTWIFTIARNLRFDLLRKNVREKYVITSDEIWQSLSQNQIDQDSDLEILHERKELHALLDELPDDQKDVIKQVYLIGHTQEEYSKMTGLALGTVKSRIRLAIRKLNSLMESV